jgi:hypothetical protein
LWGLDNKKKRVLAYLYDFRNTPSEPPDRRVSLAGLVVALKSPLGELSHTMEELENNAYVRSWRVGKATFFKLTSFGVAELESRTEERWIQGEVSTSRIGIDLGRKATSH